MGNSQIKKTFLLFEMHQNRCYSIFCDAMQKEELYTLR